MKSKIHAMLFVTVILLTSIAAATIPAAKADARFSFDDSHTTARFGNTKVCGDHLCGPGEFSKMIQRLSEAQKLTKVPTTPTQTYIPHPTINKPVTNQTVTNQTVTNQTVTNQTVTNQTVTNQTVTNQTVTNQTVTNQTVTNQTVTNQTVTNQTVTNQTVTNQTQSIPSTAQNMTSMPIMVSPTWNTQTGTKTSIQDPGLGHESHQLAIILPPSDKIYSGVISWTSSEPIQIVELTGPLGDGEDKGQPIWTTDGQIKFGLTLVDLKQSTGSFAFTGSALAIHYPDKIPFTISYSVSYMESTPSDTVKSGTLRSVQDPGQGHESHQLALILPPSDKPYHGILTYSASENIQLVSLIGPIDPADKKGQAVYTMDGKTWYALVFVDPGNQMGTWQFSGNAIAVHTKNTTPFHVSYTVDAHK